MAKLERGVNDLATLYPELAKEWHPTKNGYLKPCDVTCHTKRKVWWKCKECGYEWETGIGTRVNCGSGCPECGRKVGVKKRQAELIKNGNDLATLYPELANEWHPTKNGDLKPCDVTVGSGRKVWWLLPYDDPETGKHFDFEWEARIDWRVSGGGCPYLSKNGGSAWKGFNDLETLYPDLASEWHPTKNGDLKPCDVTKGKSVKLWWKCKNCGHEWKASVNSRTGKRRGCPKCAYYTQTSFREQAIYYYILIEFPDAINRYVDLGKELDIFIPSMRVSIEYDGEVYHQDLEKDIDKNIWCKQKGISLYRIRESGCPTLSDDISKNIIVDTSLDNLGMAIEEVLHCLGKNTKAINVQDNELEIKSLYFSTLKENSLQSKYPELANEWHPFKNEGITPDKVSCGQHIKVWWRCSHCGKEWQASVSGRTSRGLGCPECGKKKCVNTRSVNDAKRKLIQGKNDIATVRPDLVKEWDFEKNGLYTPDKATCYTNEKVYWICSNCGESYYEFISNKCNGYGKCPKCGN